jgi:hypothetical protein
VFLTVDFQFLLIVSDLGRVLLWQPAQENTVLSPKPIHFGHQAIVKYHPVVSCRVNTR